MVGFFFIFYFCFCFCCFTSSSVNGLLMGCFQTSVLWRMLLWTRVWVSLLKSAFSFFEYVLGSGIAGLWHFCVQGVRLFVVLSTSHLASPPTVLQASFSLCPHQHPWAFIEFHFVLFSFKVESWISWEESLNKGLSRSSWPVGISGGGWGWSRGWGWGGICLAYVNSCGKIHPSVGGITP